MLQVPDKKRSDKPRDQYPSAARPSSSSKNCGFPPPPRGGFGFIETFFPQQLYCTNDSRKCKSTRNISKEGIRDGPQAGFPGPLVDNITLSAISVSTNSPKLVFLYMLTYKAKPSERRGRKAAESSWRRWPSCRRTKRNIGVLGLFLSGFRP